MNSIRESLGKSPVRPNTIDWFENISIAFSPVQCEVCTEHSLNVQLYRLIGKYLNSNQLTTFETSHSGFEFHNFVEIV